MDAIGSARTGLMAAQARFERSAGRVAQMDIDPTVDLATETVELVKARHEFSANLQVIRFADDMWRSLLEIQHR